MTPLSWIQGNALSLLGGALGLSIAGNVGLTYMLKHQTEKTVQCKDAVIAVNTDAKKTKTIVENRSKKNVSTTEITVRGRITSALGKLHDSQSREPDLPEIAFGPGRTDGEGPAPVVLSDLKDKEICIVNTLLAEGWQEFYTKQLEIQEEQNVQIDTKDRTVRTIGGGTSTGSVQGLGRSVDMGGGSDEQVRTRSLPEVQGQATDVGEVSGDYGVASGGEVPAFGLRSVRPSTSIRIGVSGSSGIPLEYGEDR